MPTICSARSSAAFGPISRRSKIAPTMISSMFPACWPTTLQNGSALSPMSSCALTAHSAMKIPGQSRNPHR